MQLNGRTILLTGASAGIGRELAFQLADQGATVVMVARDQNRLSAVGARHPHRLVSLPADLTLPEEQDRVIEYVTHHWPDLSVVINNAGVQINLSQTGIASGDKLPAMRCEIDLNLVAPVALSLGLLPVLAVQKNAMVVNISSALAIAPKRSAPVYCATKAGLSTFSRGLRYRCEDVAPGVRVLDVKMDLVDTAMTEARTHRKMPAADAARHVVRAMATDQQELWVGRTRMLRVLHRLSPAIAYRLLRSA